MKPFLNVIVALVIAGIVVIVLRLFPKPAVFDQAILALAALAVLLYALAQFGIWSGF